LISVRTEDLTFINPFGSTNDEKNGVLKTWKAFCKTRNDLQLLNWTEERVGFTKQEDSYNCGVFICSFIEKFINYDFNYKIDPSPENLLGLRKAIHKKLPDNATN